MPWTAPVNPVSGTVITVSYAVSNILDPLRWLRLMTGNADPPGSSYVPLSSSVSAVAWSKVTTDALADGAVADTKLANQKVNRSGDVMTGDLTVSRASSGLPNVGVLLLGQTGGLVYIHHDGSTIHIQGRPVHMSGALTVDGAMTAGPITAVGDLTAYRPATPTAGYVVLGNTPAHFIGFDGTNIVADGNKIWTQANDGPTSGLAAQTAALADNATNAANATTVGGLTPTVSPGPGRIPIADGAGKLDAWVTSSGGGGVTEMVGGMVIGWTGGVGSIPGGWTRYTAADGRLLVGAGTSGEHTFVDANSYGTTWAHSHTSPSHGHDGVSHAHSGASLGVAGTVDSSPSTLNGRYTAGGANALPDNHTHTFTLDVSGNTDGTTASVGSTTSTVDATTILLPVRALIWIVKS